MSRIEIRGVIVPSFYDTEWAQQYIEKGLITPESTFRTALSEAATDAPLEVYVNSPGGSVFSAYEMVNAVRDWKRENNQKANVTIGAIAASEAMCKLVQGKTLEEALKITHQDIVEELEKMPAIKIHCSVLGRQALQKAVENYRKK